MSKVRPSHSGAYQLPFPLHSHEKCSFENFYDKPNEVVLACLKQLIKQSNFTHSVYLWGQTGVGCTHLLKACCEAAKQAGLRATYLSLAEVMSDCPIIDLAGLVKSSEFVCLDDIDRIAGYAEWEERLFEIYNHLVSKGVPMVFAAHQVPRNLGFNLLDLVSRLNSGLLFKINPLNDAEKIAALQLRARLRGYELSEPVAQFLLARLHRNPRVLLEAFNRLDLFSLAQKRKLTMPFVKAVLKL